jgi:hypothetical protein
MPNLKKRTKVTCNLCKKVFSVNNGELRNRLKRSKTGNLFCSKLCVTEHRKQEVKP